jgi:hypothetical protein
MPPKSNESRQAVVDLIRTLPIEDLALLMRTHANEFFPDTIVSHKRHQFRVTDWIYAPTGEFRPVGRSVDQRKNAPVTSLCTWLQSLKTSGAGQRAVQSAIFQRPDGTEVPNKKVFPYTLKESTEKKSPGLRLDPGRSRQHILAFLHSKGATADPSYLKDFLSPEQMTALETPPESVRSSPKKKRSSPKKVRKSKEKAEQVIENSKWDDDDEESRPADEDEDTTVTEGSSAEQQSSPLPKKNARKAKKKTPPKPALDVAQAGVAAASAAEPLVQLPSDESKQNAAKAALAVAKASAAAAAAQVMAQQQAQVHQVPQGLQTQAQQIGCSRPGCTRALNPRADWVDKTGHHFHPVCASQVCADVILSGFTAPFSSDFVALESLPDLRLCPETRDRQELTSWFHSFRSIWQSMTSNLSCLQHYHYYEGFMSFCSLCGDCKFIARGIQNDQLQTSLEKIPAFFQCNPARTCEKKTCAAQNPREMWTCCGLPIDDQKSEERIHERIHSQSPFLKELANVDSKVPMHIQIAANTFIRNVLRPHYRLCPSCYCHIPVPSSSSAASASLPQQARVIDCHHCKQKICEHCWKLCISVQPGQVHIFNSLSFYLLMSLGENAAPLYFQTPGVQEWHPLTYETRGALINGSTIMHRCSAEAGVLDRNSAILCLWQTFEKKCLPANTPVYWNAYKTFGPVAEVAEVAKILGLSL